MKRRITALAAACITALAGLPAFPAGAEAAEGGLHTRRFENRAQLRSAAENGGFAPVSGSVPAAAGVLPSRYDMREEGLVTPVKTQENYGMCWSFAAMASLESTLVKRNPFIDLSEWHLAYYTYSDVFGYAEERMRPEELFLMGGNTYILSTLLTRGIGPVAEERFPFNDFDVLDPEATPEEAAADTLYQVTSVKLLPYEQGTDAFEQQINAVRQAVFDGHAVLASYQNQSWCFSSDDQTYYTPVYDDGYSTYHAVTIVGWDDDFPAERFVNDPGRNGAWLVKNSWGSWWGDNGYFWLSYEDASVVELSYLEAEPVQVHDGQYRHDDYGFWSAFSIDDTDTGAYAANVFTAQEDTWLTSVMFATAMTEESYSIRVYSELADAERPDSGTPSAATVGMVHESGYHTVDLAEPVFLKAGERFSIVIRFRGDDGYHIPCEASMDYTYSDGDSEATLITEAMIEKDFGPGESFYSADGLYWFDMFDEEVYTDSYMIADGDGELEVTLRAKIGNICVRGLTQEPGRVVFSDYDEALPSGTAVTLKCPGADAIRYTVNGGEERLYTEPIVITEETELTARAVCGGTDYPAYTQHYAIRTAQLSSLLDTETSDYITFEQLDDTVFTATITDAGVLSLLPVTTGTILCDTAVLSSGRVTEVDTDRPALTFRVQDEGMQESLYVLYFTEDIRGDVNLDGEIDAADAAAVLAYAAAAGTGQADDLPDAAWLARADYNADGTPDASDAADILAEAARRGAGE